MPFALRLQASSTLFALTTKRISFGPTSLPRFGKCFCHDQGRHYYMDDTETLIAIIFSLLPVDEGEFSQDDVMNALIESNGDPEGAAQLLQSAPGPSRKRRRVDLHTWLKSPSNKKQETQNAVSFRSNYTTIGTPERETKRKPVSSSASVKPPVDLMSVLKQPPSPQKGPIQLPPMVLSSPELVAKHTPCTLHPSVLPADLACQLFYTMVNLSKRWKRNKWWLFDKVVESPHLTSFFARKTNGIDDDESWQQAAQYWYNGRATEPPAQFPAEMERACQFVEKVVNDEMRKRPHFKLEWGGGNDEDLIWRANVAASNSYRGGKESVGFHSDQLTYLGPYPTIASLSLGTRRNFSLREVIPADQAGVRKAQTFNVPLPHNSLIIMHASCQERFKHSIPPQNAVDLFRPTFPQTPGDTTEPSNCRINITFRFYRPDFRPSTIPRCQCGVPCILRPDMKNRNNEDTDRYWWTCYAGAQNEGKGCKFWKSMDMNEEGRGP